MALKWKWDKSQSSRFVRCGASGVYNFYYNIASGKHYEVTAIQETRNDSIKYFLFYVEQEVYKSPTIHKELGIFNTSIEAKRYAEAI